MTPIDELLYPQVNASLSYKLTRFLQEFITQRNPELDYGQKESLWRSQPSMGCPHQTSPPKLRYLCEEKGKVCKNQSLRMIRQKHYFLQTELMHIRTRRDCDNMKKISTRQTGKKFKHQKEEMDQRAHSYSRCYLQWICVGKENFFLWWNDTGINHTPV